MAACFRSDHPGLVQSGVHMQGPVQDDQVLPSRPSYLEILKTALPSEEEGEHCQKAAPAKQAPPCDAFSKPVAEDSESTISEAVCAPVGVTWADLSEDGWSASEEQLETVAEATQPVPHPTDEPVPHPTDASVAPASSDEAEPSASPSHARRRRRHRHKKGKDASTEEPPVQAGLDASPPANRYVVTWDDLGSSLLLGPAGGGTTKVAQKAEPPAMGVGVCTAFSAWSNSVYRPADAQNHVGNHSGAVNANFAAAGHLGDRRSAMGSWLRFANGLPSCGELAQQLHAAEPAVCADLAVLLQAAAPETYED